MLIRVFIGGALQEELIDLADDQLVDIAQSELGELLGVRGEQLFHRIARLPASMPQYYVGHRQRVATIQQRAAVAILISVSGMVLLFFMVGREPAVASNSVLVLRVEGDLAEVSSGSLFDPFMAARQPSLRSLVDNLRKAKADRRMTSVIVTPVNLSSAYWGKLQELRDAIADFRTSGKKAVAYLEYGGDREYFLATACDRVFLLPTSPLDLNGLASYELFLRGTLDKIGAYAGLPPYRRLQDRRRTSSPRRRSRRRTARWRIVEPRLFRPARAGHRRGPQEDGRRGAGADRRRAVPAEDALHAGLVDGLAYEDQLDDKLPPASGPLSGSRATTTPASQQLGRARIAARASPSSTSSASSTRGASGFDPLNGPVAGSDTLVEAIRKARDDSAVKAIVLRIDSPGGSRASDVIWRELTLAARRDDSRAAGGLDVRPGGVGRLLHRDGGAGHRRGAGHADRLHRHLRRQDRHRRPYEKLGINVEAVSAGKYDGDPHIRVQVVHALDAFFYALSESQAGAGFGGDLLTGLYQAGFGPWALGAHRRTSMPSLLPITINELPMLFRASPR